MFRDLNARIRRWFGGDEPPEPDQAVLLAKVNSEMEAAIVRDKLEERGLSCAPVTSGSKGLHMYAALPGDKSADEVRDLAQEVAQELTEEHGDLVLWKMTKNLRHGKVFLDWSQNTAAKTTITPYSLRGRNRPYVAAPRTWDEIESGAEDPEEIDHLLLDEALARIDAEGDVFGDLLHGR